MKILVIAAHPDDEVLGMGGTIKKYTKSGNQVKKCPGCQTTSRKKLRVLRSNQMIISIACTCGYLWKRISGKYLRRKDDWKRLCTSCHRKFDNHSAKMWESRRGKNA